MLPESPTTMTTCQLTEDLNSRRLLPVMVLVQRSNSELNSTAEHAGWNVACGAGNWITCDTDRPTDDDNDENDSDCAGDCCSG